MGFGSKFAMRLLLSEKRRIEQDIDKTCSLQHNNLMKLKHRAAIYT
jgi:hypothetical protein